jgi:tetratricopeptide (TPR) repeat protein
MLHITIFLHSLLDFDFSFATIFILYIIPVAFANTKLMQKSITHTYTSLSANNVFKASYAAACTVILIFGIYIFFCDAIVFAGKSFYSYKSYNNALLFYNIADRLQFKANPYTCLSIAEIYNQKSDDKKELNKSIRFLERSENINPYDPIIAGNMAFTFEKLGVVLKADNYYLKFIKKERFYYKSYNLYYSFLKKHYSKNSSNYKLGKAVMKKTYAKAKKALNTRAVYMKAQLPNKFSNLR